MLVLRESNEDTFIVQMLTQYKQLKPNWGLKNYYGRQGAVVLLKIHDVPYLRTWMVKVWGIL